MTQTLSILKAHEDDILSEWISRQQSAAGRKGPVQPDSQLREQSRLFLQRFREGMQSGSTDILESREWKSVRDFLQDLSAERAQQGYSPSETATFVFSLKEPLFQRLQSDLGKNPDALGKEVWSATLLLDQLGVYTTEVYQKSREELIIRQQQEMIELSTPVIQLWKGVLALPLIGTLDSNRTQVVMETLLQRIVETGSAIAIIDITGVPTVDTMVAQHLMKTVAAARLMGTECMISGIRPQIAQTMVHLGVALGDVTTKATLAGAFATALHKMRLAITDVKA
jgi:rsbT co-antagonist protein RsbR